MMIFKEGKSTDSAVQRRRNQARALTAVAFGIALFIQSIVAGTPLAADNFGDITGSKNIGCGDGADDTAGSVILFGTNNFNNGGGGGKGTVSDLLLLNSAVFRNGVYGGEGTVGNLDMYGGTFYNGLSGTGTVTDLVLHGGTFINGATLIPADPYSSIPAGGTGTVANMTFYGGTYDSNAKSSVTNLTLGTSVSETQGDKFLNVRNLSFTADYGWATVAAADGGYTSDINVKAGTIDLTGVSLRLDLRELYDSPEVFAAAVNAAGFDAVLQTMFASDYTTVTGSDAIKESLWLFGNQTFKTSYSDVLSAAGNGGMNVQTADSHLTPEPASVLLFGLGLAGLAAARRRQMRQQARNSRHSRAGM